MSRKKTLSKVLVLSLLVFNYTFLISQDSVQSVDLNLNSKESNQPNNFLSVELNYSGSLNRVSLIGNHTISSYSKNQLTQIAESKGQTVSDIDIYSNEEQSLQTVNYTLGFGASLKFLSKTSNEKLYLGPYLSYTRFNFEKTTYGVLFGTDEYTYTYEGSNNLTTIGAKIRYNVLDKPKHNIYLEGGLGLGFSNYSYGYQVIEDSVITYTSEDDNFRGNHFVVPIDLNIGYNYSKIGVNFGLSTSIVQGRSKRNHTKRSDAGDGLIGRLIGSAGGEVDGFAYETTNARKNIALFFTAGISYRLFDNIK